MNMTSKEELFYKSRITFAFLNGKLYWADDLWKHRKCRDWLNEEFNIDEAEFKSVVHGSCHKDGHVVIAIGDSYDSINFESLESSDLIDIVSKACDYAGTNSVEIWNGVKIGDSGEVWPPLYNEGSFAK